MNILKVFELICIIFIIIIVIFIINTKEYDNEKKHKHNKLLPSCKPCKKKLNDFCSETYCNEPNCKIDPKCSNEIKYSCSHHDYDCNEFTCNDFEELKKNKSWGCYDMFS